MISVLPSQATSETRWLSLKQACALLGVNANSLRAWADQGEIRSFRTPGGHRRFAEADLLALTQNAHRGVPPGLPDRALAHIRRKITTSPVTQAPWVHLLPEAERGELRALGRRLIALAVSYLATPKGRAALNAEARTIGERYGSVLGQHGLAFSQMLEAFLFFRNLVEEMAQRIPRQGAPASSSGASSFRTLNSLLDQVLLGTVRGYEQQTAPRAAVPEQTAGLA